MRASDKKFADAFRAAGMEDYAKRAEQGEFNEFFGLHSCPMVFLVNDLVDKPEAQEIRRRIMNGDFDDTGEDSEEWAASAEGQDAMRRLIRKE